MRIFQHGILAVLALAALPAAVRAQQAAPDTLLSDCGRQGLTSDAIDSCLERVRVREETAPSPDLQSLEAQLEQEAKGEAAPSSASAGTGYPVASSVETPPAGTQGSTEQATAQPRALSGTATEAVPADDQPQTARPGTNNNVDNNDLLAGPDGADEPPVADPPDDGMTSDTSKLDPDSPSQPPDPE